MDSLISILLKLTYGMGLLSCLVGFLNIKASRLEQYEPGIKKGQSQIITGIWSVVIALIADFVLTTSSLLTNGTIRNARDYLSTENNREELLQTESKDICEVFAPTNTVIPFRNITKDILIGAIMLLGIVMLVSLTVFVVRKVRSWRNVKQKEELVKMLEPDPLETFRIRLRQTSAGLQSLLNDLKELDLNHLTVYRVAEYKNIEELAKSIVSLLEDIENFTDENEVKGNVSRLISLYLPEIDNAVLLCKKSMKVSEDMGREIRKPAIDILNTSVPALKQILAEVSLNDVEMANIDAKVFKQTLENNGLLQTQTVFSTSTTSKQQKR